MSSRQSFLAGMVTTAAVVMFYMENIFESPTTYDVKVKYVEVEIPAKKPNFTEEVKTISSTLNKSKLKHQAYSCIGNVDGRGDTHKGGMCAHGCNESCPHKKNAPPMGKHLFLSCFTLRFR